MVPLALSDCGFTPLYVRGDMDPSTSLAQVSVALIADRNGQLLREDLQGKLGQGQNDGTASRYDLYVTLAINEGDIAIDQQSASTRVREFGTAGWTLKAQDAAHSVLATGAAHALDGFDVINQQFFAADLAREQASRRLDSALADRIIQQLAVYFRLHRVS